MAKLTPQPHVECPKDDLFLTLGPPSEEFVRCEQTFIVTIDEMMWPGHQPFTADEIRDMLSKFYNPRSPQIEVEELDVE